jgi:hypothetical protein
MTKITKKGDTAMNARIKIDYSKSKPDIRFSFPNKRTQFSASYYSWLRLFTMFLIFIFFIGYELGSLIWGYSLFYGDNMLDRTVQPSALEEFTLCANKYLIKNQTDYHIVRTELCKPKQENIFVNMNSLYFMIAIFISFYLIPLIIYLPFRKFWNNKYPATEAFFSTKKYRTFTKKDIKENENGIYIELPVFKNVVCNFEATKDFSKYMKEFEIEEYKFHYNSKKKIKIGKKRKKFYKVNEWIWYARWYFKQRPLKGKLEVIYK